MRTKKILIGVITLLLTFTFIACDKGNVGVDIWTKPSTEKVLLDYQYDEEYKADKTVEIKMVKGEYESYQIILTPLDNVLAYTVEVGELKSGDHVFEANNIEVFKQKYLEVVSSTIGGLNGPLGYYPDALLPIDKAIEYKENNIEKDHNQGLWITFKTDKDTEAGVYEGKVSITIDGEETFVSLKVEVVDYYLEPTNTAKSVFPIERENLIYGEYDNTLGMYKKYVDFLLDFRMAAYLLPAIDKNVEDYIRVSKTYALDERVPSYAIPVYYVYNAKANDIDVDYDLLESYLVAMANVYLNEGIDLLSKAYLYIGIIDEPELGGIIPRAQRVTNSVKELKEKVSEAILDNQDYELEEKQAAVNLINDIDNLVTNKLNTELKDYVDNFTPLFDDFDSLNRREEYQEMDDDIWWYGCIGPQNPYPTYHLDDVLVSSRIVSWMQFDYKIAGNLYWETSLYQKVVQNENGVYVRVPIDAYDEASRFPGVNGDGWLTYPGAPYGIDGPLASIRMHSIRDGLEEYEMLKDLENQQKVLANKYGVNSDITELLVSLYDSLYEGTKVLATGEEFIGIRNKLIDFVLLFNSDEEVVLENMTLVDETFVLDIVTEKDVTLSSSNKSFVIDELETFNRYSVTLDMNSKNNVLNIKNDDKNIETSIDFGGDILLIGQYNNLDNLDSKDIMEVLQGKDFSSNLSDEVVGFNLSSLSNYIFTLDISNEDISFENLSKLILAMYNSQDYKVKFDIYIKTTNNELLSKLYDGNLKPGYNQISLNHIAELDFDRIGDIEYLQFEFYSENNDNLTILLDKLMSQERG